MTENIITIRQLIEYGADKYGNKDFMRFFHGDEMCSKSFVEFHEDCLSVCRYIRSVDTQRKHIAFLGKTSYEYVTCLTGIIFSGNVAVPFDPNISVDEACELFERADIEMLFCEEEFADKAKEIQSRYSGLKKIVSLGDWQWFADVYEKYNSQSEYASLSDFEVDPDAMTLLIFTSGTTGVRKGVMLSNRGIAKNTCYDAFAMENDDVSFSMLPMHHVFCYNCDVLKTLYDGGTLCINGALVNLYKNLLLFQPTAMRMVPSLIQSMLTKIKILERRNPQLTKREAAESIFGKNFKRILSGSAFLSPTLIDSFEDYGIAVRTGYGMSETSARVTTTDFSEECKYSTGKLTGVDELVIADDGEILIKGPSLMLGYYKMPDETAEVLDNNGYLHTGDLGRLDGDHLYLLGRKKNLIILSNGENISPEEIENKFLDDIIIKELVVYAKNDRIFAEIYPNYDLAASQGIEDIDAEIEKIVDRVNLDSPSDRQIDSYEIRKIPFERTSTGKLKRSSFYFQH
ncbi:MAG: AMP-binding protein [Faecalibacterium sp.]|nr:AMP-binding protein [Ruminococcus sp.]MCM1392778.1 AMP-binding protein [Ruminococcus sp.]MCM1486078.1 AMP-binding protein [Faecalibacterium sp.]